MMVVEPIHVELKTNIGRSALMQYLVCIHNGMNQNAVFSSVSLSNIWEKFGINVVSRKEALRAVITT